MDKSILLNICPFFTDEPHHVDVKNVIGIFNFIEVFHFLSDYKFVQLAKVESLLFNSIHFSPLYELLKSKQ